MPAPKKSVTIRKLKVINAKTGAAYSIDRITETAGVSRRLVLDLCQWRVIEPVKGRTPETYRFSEEAIYRIRRADRLIRAHSLKASAARILLHLIEENERLRHELRFWRG
ncbi:chaperone modulator CbpM [Oscillatoria amoena NRMC-F 0135]|nr:chaperone modulator CbpM [Oscillatoria laete-virens]MDL5050409.1 chaperone modulator CbpM [Oscillatoria amoena NRMC-F 0135]MDL5054193.1 chaperone modulator CbpM [Oscillatoria laete-virens NRMC-F 0139]